MRQNEPKRSDLAISRASPLSPVPVTYLSTLHSISSVLIFSILSLFPSRARGRESSFSLALALALPALLPEHGLCPRLRPRLRPTARQMLRLPRLLLLVRHVQMISLHHDRHLALEEDKGVGVGQGEGKEVKERAKRGQEE
jgi:hypothetical protein